MYCCRVDHDHTIGSSSITGVAGPPSRCRPPGGTAGAGGRGQGPGGTAWLCTAGCSSGRYAADATPWCKGVLQSHTHTHTHARTHTHAHTHTCARVRSCLAWLAPLRTAYCDHPLIVPAPCVCHSTRNAAHFISRCGPFDVALRLMSGQNDLHSARTGDMDLPVTPRPVASITTSWKSISALDQRDVPLHLTDRDRFL